ncbi:MAG TPA: hypothetical protein EYP22_03835 [Methanosarcinales archaeon]|nr:hypothetical protein [Methanosarcinales archaeon]
MVQKTMKIWLTTIGMSTFAVVNTLWAACKQDNYIPQRVYLVKNDIVESKGKVKEVLDWMKRILKEYDVDAEFVFIDADENNFKEFAKKIREAVRKEKLDDNEIAIDMTPGRKFMSAFSMYLGLGKDVKYHADLVYYLHLIDMSYKDYPYMQIPMHLQKLYEMKKELMENKK